MNKNVEEWLAGAPADVTETTERLLAEVAGMRAEGQTIYPPQDDILNALAWTAPADVRAVILGPDPYHEALVQRPRRLQAAAEPAQHLQRDDL